jgi:hypothetical protein
MATLRHFELALLNPAFDSPRVDVLTEQAHLRRLQLGGSTPAPVFFQLKHLMRGVIHALSQESFISAPFAGGV